MRLYLPVQKVEADTAIRGAKRFIVTLGGDPMDEVRYTTATQPLVGQRMVVTIEAQPEEPT